MNGASVEEATGQTPVVEETVNQPRSFEREEAVTDTADVSPASDNELTGLDDIESELDDAETEAASGDEESTDSSLSVKNQLDSKNKSKTETLDIEEVRVKGPDGRKQKIKIDYSDKQAIKQAYLKAAGMRKFQLERDSIKKEYSELQEKHQDLTTTWDSMEKAYSEQGAAGVLELLNVDLDSFIEDQLKHREYLSNLSPVEKQRMELEQKQAEWQAKLEHEKTQREIYEERIQKQEELAETKRTESMVVPSFDRYRFAGKLGNPTLEAKADKMLWNEFQSLVEDLDDNAELTQAMIDRTFRNASKELSQLFGKQADSAAKSTVARKKQEAAKRVQVAATRGGQASDSKKKFVNDIKGNNFTDAFRAFLNGDVKLK